MNNDSTNDRKVTQYKYKALKLQKNDKLIFQKNR